MAYFLGATEPMPGMFWGVLVLGLLPYIPVTLHKTTS